MNPIQAAQTEAVIAHAEADAAITKAQAETVIAEANAATAIAEAREEAAEEIVDEEINGEDEDVRWAEEKFSGLENAIAELRELEKAEQLNWQTLYQTLATISQNLATILEKTTTPVIISNQPVETPLTPPISSEVEPETVSQENNVVENSAAKTSRKVTRRRI